MALLVCRPASLTCTQPIVSHLWFAHRLLRESGGSPAVLPPPAAPRGDRELSGRPSGRDRPRPDNLVSDRAGSLAARPFVPNSPDPPPTTERPAASPPARVSRRRGLPTRPARHTSQRRRWRSAASAAANWQAERESPRQEGPGPGAAAWRR